MIPTLVAGLLMSGLISGVTWRLAGGPSAIAALVFGILATVLQLMALGLVQGATTGPVRTFIKRWGFGMGLRLLGVVSIALAVGLDPTHFPPIPTAVGFLGVLLPLLFFEVRLVR